MVQQLCNMGFSHDLVLKATRKYPNSMDKAITFITSQQQQNVIIQYPDTNGLYSSDKCLENNCLNRSANKLKQLLNGYNIEEIDNDQIVQLLNIFVHLINNHDGNSQYIQIMNIMKKCSNQNKMNCESFNRHFRIVGDILVNARKQIWDKIHCYYYHLCDIGYRRTSTYEQKMEIRAPQPQSLRIRYILPLSLI